MAALFSFEGVLVLFSVVVGVLTVSSVNALESSPQPPPPVTAQPTTTSRTSTISKRRPTVDECWPVIFGIPQLPTLPPIQFPTIPPIDWDKIFKSLPTLPPLVFPTLPPIGQPRGNCIPKLLAAVKIPNGEFCNEIDALTLEGNVTQIMVIVIQQAKIDCTATDTAKLEALLNEHKEAWSAMDMISGSLTADDREKVKNWIIDNNTFALSTFTTQLSLANLLHPTLPLNILKTSIHLSAMQFQLAINPI